MSVVSSCGSSRRAIRGESLKAAAFVAADGLCFAAAPACATMALLTGLHAGEAPPMFCTAAPGVSPHGGMATMYWLMCMLHAPPWLRAISALRRRS